MKFTEFQVGKLYEIQEDFWLVFPSLLSANHHRGVATSSRRAHVVDSAAYWSRELKVSVSHVSPLSVFMVLSVSTDPNYLEVLFTDSMGWIRVPDWTLDLILEK